MDPHCTKFMVEQWNCSGMVSSFFEYRGNLVFAFPHEFKANAGLHERWSRLVYATLAQAACWSQAYDVFVRTCWLWLAFGMIRPQCKASNPGKSFHLANTVCQQTIFCKTLFLYFWICKLLWDSCFLRSSTHVKFVAPFHQKHWIFLWAPAFFVPPQPQITAFHCRTPFPSWPAPWESQAWVWQLQSGPRVLERYEIYIR